jgi:hypothetical protein
MVAVADTWKQSSNAFLDFVGIRSSYLGLAPGARIAAYVHASGAAETDFQEIKARIYTTLNAALAECREDKGDVVLVLPGHTENVASADQMSNLVKGSRIVGGGHGEIRPTFTWSAAGSTFLLDQDSTTIENCILNLEPGTGTVTVAAPITVSGNGCAIIGCDMRVSTDADNKVTQAMTVTGDDFTFAGNHMYGATAGEVTACIDFNAAHRLQMVGNVVEAATSNADVGVVRMVTAASLNCYFANNVYINRKASSTVAFIGLAGCSGVSLNEHYAYLDTSSLTAWDVSAGIMTHHRPTVTNTAGETGTEVVGTVSA